MGQQQMLILVFGIVSVGAFVMVGAYTFREHSVLQNRPKVVHEALQVVADMQAWKDKPVALGGGAGRPGFSHVTFRTLGYAHTMLSNRVYKTKNGCYKLQTVGELQHAEFIFYAPSCAKSDFVARVIISGPGPGDLDWQHTPPESFTLFR